MPFFTFYKVFVKSKRLKLKTLVNIHFRLGYVISRTLITPFPRLLLRILPKALYKVHAIPELNDNQYDSGHENNNARYDPLRLLWRNADSDRNSEIFGYF